MTDIQQDAGPWVRRLKLGSDLSPKEIDALSMLCRTVRTCDARIDLGSEGDERRKLIVIVSGWACIYKQLENGARQIVALLMPGDICQPFGGGVQRRAFSLGTLTPVSYARVDPDALRAIARDNQAIEQALWWDAELRADLQNEHIVSLGRRTAPERLGHLFCELYARLSMVGLINRPEFAFPLTQLDLADLLGLSIVHVNRTLKELREAELVTLRGRHVTIQDLGELAAFAQFDPAYLHLSGCFVEAARLGEPCHA